MEVKVFTTKTLQDCLPEDQLRTLANRFREYKATGVPHESFGRDAAYHEPSSAKFAELQHLHLHDGRNWRLAKLQFHKTSDTHLVYCPGNINPNCFLLITILTDAHLAARNFGTIIQLIEIAEKFRKNH